ncbi:amidohydrolase [Boletus coccyginus]|nr:amidohydrolase [Boletus coccyginus]
MHVPPLDDHGHNCCFSLKRLLTSNPPPRTTDQTYSTSSPVDRSVKRADTNVNDIIAGYGDIPISFESCCDFHSSPTGQGFDPPPTYFGTVPQFDAEYDVKTTIITTVDTIDSALRSLSLSIHGHPELMFEEHYAHDTLTDVMESHGFVVTRHYLGLQTAWRAEFTHGKGGRTIGINAEMDALPLIGHACGHNLIAVSGVGVAIAIKSALLAHNVTGKVVLLGTPGEEGGGGKITLLERGGYKGMDACLMCHPSAGSPNSLSTGTCLAMQSIDVEFFGRSAHAGNAPWEGANALDAAFLAYSNVSVLRQQIKPDHRISGVIRGCDAATNVIPDYAQMHWLLRAPDRDQLQHLRERVELCFRGAVIATGCRLKITEDKPYYDLRQNEVLGRNFSHIMSSSFGMDARQVPFGASTDFGNVSYEMPSLHPSFAIPTQPRGGNHTPAFAISARSIEAHKICMTLTKGLAWTGFLVLADDNFYAEVRDEYQQTLGALSAQ